MHRHPSDRSPRPSPRLALPALIALTAATLVAIAWPPAAALLAKAPTHAESEPPPHSTASAPLPALDAATPTTREAVALPPLPPEPSFEQRIDELVRLGQRTAELAQQDEIDAAKAADQEARLRFDDLLHRHADAGERALGMLVGIDDAPATTPAGTPAEAPADPIRHGRRIVLQLVLDHDLARRHAAAEAAADRSRIDALVQSVLDVLPTNATSLAVGERALVEQPYLRAVHEPTVLSLLRLASEGAFPRPTATALLLTLWRNLQRFGERSSDELSRLALLLLGDGDPSQRTAACRHLIGDARYRPLVLAWLRERGDHAVAAELAGLAARELEPALAMAVLRELGPVLPRAPNAYLLLGFRAPELVATTYRELLAADTHPETRSDLVTGVGMTPTPLGIEIAELALHNDPSPDVRLQAVFTLTARAPADTAERAIGHLLDDPAFANDPMRLGAVVVALQNLEAGGHANALHRIGERLRTMALGTESRASLEQLLQRSLPGGGRAATSR